MASEFKVKGLGVAYAVAVACAINALSSVSVAQSQTPAFELSKDLTVAAQQKAELISVAIIAAAQQKAARCPDGVVSAPACEIEEVSFGHDLPS